MGDYSQALWYPLEDCTLVRAAISPDLGERDLPDAIIDSPVYAYLAVRDVQGRFPTWATLDPDQQNDLHTAIILLTAALLVPVVPIPTEKVIGPYTAHYQENKADLAGELRSRAANLLDAVGVTMTPYVPAIPTFFTLGKGHRVYTPPNPVTTGRPPQVSPPPYPPEGWG